MTEGNGEAQDAPRVIIECEVHKAFDLRRGMWFFPTTAETVPVQITQATMGRNRHGPYIRIEAGGKVHTYREDDTLEVVA